MSGVNLERLAEVMRGHFSDGWTIAQRVNDRKYVMISPKGEQYTEGELDCRRLGSSGDIGTIGDFYVFLTLYDDPGNPDSLADALGRVLGD